MTIPRASWLRLYLGNWLKRWHREPKVQVSGGSDLWSVNSSLSASSPGFGRCAVAAAAAPLAGVRSTPFCTRCPWSPGRVGSGCRWCSPFWGWAEGCRRSPGSPRRRCPQRHSPAPRVPSGGSQPGCWDTSCSRGANCVCVQFCADLSGPELLSTCLRKDYNGRVTSASLREGGRAGRGRWSSTFFFQLRVATLNGCADDLFCTPAEANIIFDCFPNFSTVLNFAQPCALTWQCMVK